MINPDQIQTISAVAPSATPVVLSVDADGDYSAWAADAENKYAAVVQTDASNSNSSTTGLSGGGTAYNVSSSGQHLFAGVQPGAAITIANATSSNYNDWLGGDGSFSWDSSTSGETLRESDTPFAPAPFMTAPVPDPFAALSSNDVAVPTNHDMILEVHATDQYGSKSPDGSSSSGESTLDLRITQAGIDFGTLTQDLNGQVMGASSMLGQPPIGADSYSVQQLFAAGASGGVDGMVAFLEHQGAPPIIGGKG